MFSEFFFLIFRGEGKEKVRKRNISVWLPLVCPRLRNWPVTQACALEWESNQQPFDSQASTQPLSHTSLGNKQRILNTTREKQRVTYKGVPIRLSADFSKETLQAIRDCKKYSQWWKARSYNIDYSIQLSFRIEGQIKCFPDKVKLKEFIITRPLLYDMLKRLI